MNGYVVWLAFALVSCAEAFNWAVLAAGSFGYENYRHQAGVCHAYTVLLRHGFLKEHIIVFAYDDIASHQDNPLKGQLFNSPDPEGPGEDVYADCIIDYKGAAVNRANFLGVLLGTGTNGGTQRVLKTTAADNIFIFYVDHGDSKELKFPVGGALGASLFQRTLKMMHRRNRYSKMLIFIEACRSGSMFAGFPDNLDILGITAVSPKVDSLATYCGPDAVINGTKIGACLGDLFTVYWLDYVTRAQHDTSVEALYTNVAQQVDTFARLHYSSETNMQYGDVSQVSQMTLAEFFYPSVTAAKKLQGSERHLKPFVLPSTVLPSQQASPLSSLQIHGRPRFHTKLLHGGSMAPDDFDFLHVRGNPAELLSGITT